MYHLTDLLTVRGVAHLVVQGTSGSTSYETIPHVQLEISGDVLSTADMVVQRRDGPRRLREIEIDDMGGYVHHCHMLQKTAKNCTIWNRDVRMEQRCEDGVRIYSGICVRIIVSTTCINA